MIAGRVSALHAFLPVTFRLPGQPDFAIEFVVDTGFTGYLMLPVSAVNALQLPYLQDIAANLATDDEVELPVYRAVIIWNGVELDVQVIAGGKRPLLGTALLNGHELVSQFVEGGLVTLDTI